MKYIFFLLIYFLFAQNTYANNPVESPTFDDILKRIIQDDKYIFDDKNINIKVPLFADNPVQVPIFVDAKAIKNAKRLIIALGSTRHRSGKYLGSRCNCCLTLVVAIFSFFLIK